MTRVRFREDESDDEAPADQTAKWRKVSDVGLFVEPNPTIRSMPAVRVVPAETITIPIAVPSTTRPALSRRDTPATQVTPLPSCTDRATISVLCGANAGASFTLVDTELLIGRDRSADVSVDDPALSRFHAQIERLGDGRFLLRDLESTNGTFVSGARVSQVILNSGDRIQLGPNFVMRFAVTDELEEMLQKRMYESATRDALTSVLNRRALFDRLEVEISHARRIGAPLSLLMIDVDEFKIVNDVHGHLAGDAVLRAIARCVQRTMREEDLVARYGGEELVVVARTTPHPDAYRLSERLRQAIEALQVEVTSSPEPINVTVSIGVASLGELPPTAGIEGLLASADARLYRAKLAGRNCTCAEG